MSFPSIEPLEDRIAPATLAGQVLTYTDIDGDQVKVTISKGALTPQMFTFIGIGNHEQLQKIDLSSLSDLAGANITLSVVQAGNGDGLASVGLINAGTNNLGKVTIHGDLGAIECGSDAAGVTGLKSLNVDTLGRFGLGTQGGSGTLESEIEGSIGKVVVHGDVTGAFIFAAGINGSMGPVTIGGSLIGTGDPHSGALESLGKMGAVKIGGDVLGGAGGLSGNINSQGTLASVTIGGSLIGSVQSSGQIFSAGNLGPVKIGGDMAAGSGAYTGYIDTFGKITSVTVGGSVIGGAQVDTGKIAADKDIGPVKIGHNLQAGPTITSGGVIIGNPVGGDEAGKISAGEGGAAGKIASITIGGSLIGGAGDDDTFTDSQNVTHNGQIYALGDIGPVKIGGDVQGSHGNFTGSIEASGNIASIAIGGSLYGGSGIDGAQLFAGGTLASVKIGHDIQGGSNATSADIGSGGTLGSVEVGGSMLGGSIAGIHDVGTVQIGGDVRGELAPTTGMISAEGAFTKIVIGGSLIGSEASETGFIAAGGSLGSVTIGHDVVGGSIDGTTGNLVNSGAIVSGAHLGSVTIGGSVRAGTDTSTGGALIVNASIRAGDDIGKLTVKGDVTGTLGSGGDATPVLFAARGQKMPTAANDLAFGTLSIGGSATRLTVLAGYDTTLAPLDGNAQIGTVKIAGDFVASNLIAGAINYGANTTNNNGTGDDNVNFGDGNDHIIGGPFVSKIESVTIGGIVEGTPDSVSDTDHYGIVAHSIASLKVDGIAIAVPAAPASVDLSNFTASDVSAVTIS